MSCPFNLTFLVVLQEHDLITPTQSVQEVEIAKVKHRNREQ